MYCTVPPDKTCMQLYEGTTAMKVEVQAVREKVKEAVTMMSISD